MFCLTTKRLLQGVSPLTPPMKDTTKDTTMTKDKRVTIRFTTDEYNKLNKNANDLNLTLSHYIRYKVLGNREKISSKCDKELLYHINRIGNNLNQIAKHCNINKSIDKLVLKELVEIERKINEIIMKR